MPGMEGTMREWKRGTLHSGSKSGPVVTNRKQAIAIGMNERRRAGEAVAQPRRKITRGRYEALKRMREG